MDFVIPLLWSCSREREARDLCAVYHTSHVCKASVPTWNKPRVIGDHISLRGFHDYVIWDDVVALCRDDSWQFSKKRGVTAASGSVHWSSCMVRSLLSFDWYLLAYQTSSVKNRWIFCYEFLKILMCIFLPTKYGKDTRDGCGQHSMIHRAYQYKRNPPCCPRRWGLIRRNSCFDFSDTGIHSVDPQSSALFF